MITQRAKSIEELEFDNLIDSILNHTTDFKNILRKIQTDLKNEEIIDQTDPRTMIEIVNNDRILALFESTEDCIRNDILKYTLERSST